MYRFTIGHMMRDHIFKAITTTCTAMGGNYRKNFIKMGWPIYGIRSVFWKRLMVKMFLYQTKNFDFKNNSRICFYFY